LSALFQAPFRDSRNADGARRRTAGNLVFLLDAARHIAAAVRGEVREERSRAA
jgi:hypothetical protein